MASRLDKLFALLESNNANIRSAAAVQIGQTSSNCQHQLPSLLNKLLPYIKHKNWSTRISAADAIRYIGKYTKLWIPTGSKSDTNDENAQLISLEKLNLLEILKIGTRLYSTDAKELEGGEMDPSVNKTEINKHLGILLLNNDVVKDFAVLDNDDFSIYEKFKTELKVSVDEAVDNSMSRKAMKRNYSKDDSSDEPKNKIAYLTKNESIVEEDVNFWPWVDFCNELLLCLWHPKWELRHGAATALRELIRSQGTVMVDKSTQNVCREEFARCHLRFLDDVVGRILCTLALDQLSDFVNDEMVAPVRESCAQCLGLITIHLSDSAVMMVTRHLLVLLDHCEWTVTHGALLGLKYVLASRPDYLDSLLPLVYVPICTHLRDSRDDDVRCAAAAALIPIFIRGTTNFTGDNEIESLRSDLWTVLSMRADYTSPGATGAILHLLQKLYTVRDDSCKEIELPPQTEIASCINRLHWCYYNYGESVRLAALRTCSAIVCYYKSRLDDIAPKTMLQVLGQLYQRVLIDDSGEVLVDVEQLWRVIVESMSGPRLAMCCAESVGSWMCAAMQPARLAYSPESLILPENDDGSNGDNKQQLPMEFFIGGRESHLVSGSGSARTNAVLRARLVACKCLSILCRRLVTVPGLDGHILVNLITQTHLRDRLALQRFVAGAVLGNWSPEKSKTPNNDVILGPLRTQLFLALEDPIYYQELLPRFREMIKCCRQLVVLCQKEKMTVSAQIGGTMNLAQCQSLVSEDLCRRLRVVDPSAETVWSCARTSVDLCASEHGLLTRLVEVALARALLAWRWLPQRLTPLIKPLMDTVRGDQRPQLQREAAKALSDLIALSSSGSHAQIDGAVGKLVRNIVTSLSDAIDGLCPMTAMEGVLSVHKVKELGQGRDRWPGQEEVVVTVAGSSGGDEVQDSGDLVKMRGCRMVLEEVCYEMTGTMMEDSRLDNGDSGNHGVKMEDGDSGNHEVKMEDGDSGNHEVKMEDGDSGNHGVKMEDGETRITECGVKKEDNDVALAKNNEGREVGRESSESVKDMGPMMEVLYSQPMEDLPRDKDNATTVGALRAMETCLPVILRALPRWLSWSMLVEYGACVAKYGLCHRHLVTRHWSARVLAILALPHTHSHCHVLVARAVLDTIILQYVVPCLDSSQDQYACEGAIELLYLALQVGLLEYRLALVVPVLATVLRSLNHSVDSVRRAATMTFSILLTLLPLEQHGANVSILTGDRQTQRLNDRHFIDGLLRPDTIGNYDVSQCIGPSLRHYQQQGVNWLSFLDRYGLHGVLADDMGLGKTLQTLAIIAGQYRTHQRPSLVVCPSSLTGHWLQEVCKHVCLSQFTAMVYSGSPDLRNSLVTSLARHSLVITSYDVLRHDLDNLQRPSSGQSWQYLVLDEGHLIRNHKSKLAQAVKQVVATHRLVLTGTPVQNKVAELWSLFDFLMPGLLGPHSDFQRRYGKPLSHSNSGGGRRVDSEAGTVALDGLHKQVLPFMLRRVKEDVLEELPAKIIQDYVCAMTPLQQRLYSGFLGSEDGARLGDDAGLACGPTVEERRHVFRALHYLRMVCNHPCLAVTEAHPLRASVAKEVAASNYGWNDAHWSGKMVALRQLMADCGLAGSDWENQGGEGRLDREEDLLAGGPAHRMLIFCQSRSMLALVEAMITRDLARVSFLRMDGSVAVKDRQNIVDRFNSDPSVDVLLLTTGVGGLGLNLTSADTVVFVEHDWNPMRDLQAMDRAHRIGQRRTVNVYRLITADSIEEKIMSLQQFKMHVAGAVVGGEDNKALSTMATESLLDLMDKEARQRPGASDPGQSGVSVDEGDGQYEAEYDLDQFVRALQ